MTDKGYRVTHNKTKSPFRPRAHMLTNEKSRRHFPIAQSREHEDSFCIRASRCKNKGKCDECVPLYRLWEEK